MENSTAMVIAELTEVRDLVEKLGAHLNRSQIELCRAIASDIIFSVEKAICTVKTGSAGEVGSVFSNGRGQHGVKEQKFSKKRKILRDWTKQVRVSAEAGAEMPHDGHSWRKYGQKDILGAKYPRAYYRCTHRKTQGCSAMKQVQKLDENPSVLDITYLGSHTCSNSYHSEPKSHLHDQQHRLLDQENSLILRFDFQNNFKLSTESSDLKNQDPVFSFSFPSTTVDETRLDHDFLCSSPIMSPTTSGSNCFPLPSCDPELDEIISAAISATESPVMDVDFMLEYGSIDYDIPFDSIFF